MLIFLTFLFLLSPFPSLQASVGERKNSTKQTPHTITTLLNIKPKPPNLSIASKISSVSQTLFSSIKPTETPSVKKTPKDKPPSSSPVKILITEGCNQKESQKDTVNTSKAQETELSLKPGSPLVMTHHITLMPGSCTGRCETEMASLKDRVENLEKEMSALMKKCSLCSEVQCPNNCSNQGKCVGEKCRCHHGFSGPDCSATSCPSNCNKNGKCVNGKCVCQTGFTGMDCSKGANKENKVSSDSSTAKQDTSSWEQTKANKTRINRKDKGERHQEQARGQATVIKITLKEPLQTNLKLNPSTKQESTGTTSVKQENKDLSLNQNVTQSTEKKSNGTLKDLVKFAKGNKESANVTVKTSSEKGKLSLSNVIENVKKPSQDNVTKVLKGGASGIQKVEKHTNVTDSSEKDKKQLQGQGKNMVEKHINVTTSTEKDKKPNQGNITPKEESSEQKMVGEKSNVSIEKDRKLHQGSIVPKDGSSGRKTVDRLLNITTAIDKDKKLLPDDDTTANKEATSENKKGETHVNVTASTEKDQKPNQGNVTPLKKGSLEKTKVEKHLNLTISTEKERKLHQSNVTPLKERTSGMRNVTTSSDKRKKLVQKNETKVVKVTPAKKTTEKHVNVTTSTGKDKLHQGNVTLLKEESSGKTKLDSFLSVTISSEKDKMLLQSNETKVLKDVAEKKRMEKHLNATTVTEKDRKLHQGNRLFIKERSPGKGKVDSAVNVKKSSEKGKKLLQGDETAVLTKVEKKEKYVNSTTSREKDRKLHQGVKEDASRKNKVNSHLNDITISKTHINRTTKLIDIGPVEVNNITATGFVITWEAPQGLFRNFTVTRREVLSGSHGEDDAEDAEDAEKSQDGDIKSDELYSSNRTSSKVHTGKADKKSAEKLSQVLTGSARSYHFRNLRPQTKYSVSLFSSGPRLRSKVQRLFVSTGPEPPTELLFSNITETSLTVSWTKPKSIVTGFKVTYTNSANGVVGSMSVDSQLSHVLISKLSVGSRYEISVRSVMGAIESEATTASVVTVPDSPTDLQIVNVTDSKALLLWKPTQAKVDHYILSYGSTKSPNVTVTVMLSGNSVEHQLRGLHRSTFYRVKIMSQINSLQSSSVSTTFTTKSGVKLQIVTPIDVTWNSAVISWKAPRLSFRSYRLTYQLGEEVKEVILNPTVFQYELTDLVAFSNYTIKVDGESEGQYISVVSTAFTTAQLPYPYPTECSQVKLNGVKKSGEAEIYPEGKDREPVWVYCDMETAGGGWTVFQRRVDGSTDFFKGWKDYSKGFGQLSAEFWLGNNILHTLTSLAPMSLRIDLRSGNDTAYARYSNFSVESEVNHYAIDLSGYSGTAGDSMRYHNARPFSTKDKDPSPVSTHCAKEYMGGWWYKNCYKANLNGIYATFSKDQGVVWIDWKGKDVSLPFTEMKLRPASLGHMTPTTQG